MELTYYGANCVRIVTKKAAITVDDNLSDLGLKSVTKPGDIALFTGKHEAPKTDLKLLIDQPGEYEVADVSIQGVGARAHLDESGINATIFKIIADDFRIVTLGHIYPELSDVQLEALGTVDILVIPVGGNGYTLDAIGASKIIRKIEPKLIIPVHYEDKAVAYEVPQAPLEEALKVIGLEPKEAVAKLKLKPGELGDTAQLAILERQ